jgi:addiction module HigA family antidote
MTNGASAFDGSITMRGMLKSWTITKGPGATKEIVMARLRNPHPGEILREEFLNAIGMSQNQLAHTIGVPGNRIHAIVNGTRAITGDTDLRLCKFFGLSEGYFLRLQNAYDTLEAKRRIAEQVAKIKPYKPDKAA